MLNNNNKKEEIKEEVNKLADKLAECFGKKWVRENWYSDYKVSSQKELNLDNITKMH